MNHKLTVKRMSLRQVAILSDEITQSSVIATEADAGFDGGEFSGPAHGDMLKERLTELAEKFGYTFEQLEGEMYARACEEMQLTEVEEDYE